MIERRIDTGTVVVYLILALTILAMAMPFIHEIAKSLSYPTEVEAGRVALWPRRATLGNYGYFFRKHGSTLALATFNSVVVTGLGTLWSVGIMCLTAFPLSRPKREFPVQRYVMMLVLVTLVFQPPLVPYFLAFRTFGLLDRLLALILAHTIFSFQLLIVVTFFRELPDELFEAAKMDGAGDFYVFLRIAMPLSKAIIATISLFSAVVLWNAFLHPMLLLRSPDKQTLQLFVRSIIAGGADTESSGNLLSLDPFAESQSSKSAIALLSIVPMVVVYPFLQKYFVKGSLQGSVKS